MMQDVIEDARKRGVVADTNVEKRAASEWSIRVL